VVSFSLLANECWKHLFFFKNRKKKFGPKQAVHVGEEIVKEVQNYCYLGLQIDSDLNWHEHVRKTRMKILSMAFALRSTLPYLPPGFMVLFK
jgi:hypothetical protein